MSVTTDEKPLLIYLHFSDNSPGDEEKLRLADGTEASVIWKDVLVEGEYPVTPGPTGPIKRKLTVIAEGQSSREQNIVAMSDLIEAHEDGAFKYVTVPTTHRDHGVDNTGYVPRPGGLRVIEKTVEGAARKVMQAALGFTEPDIKGKVQRGSIPDCSAGIFYDWWNKHKDKRYRSAMKHVALTPTPFMGNLEAFPPIFASDEEIDEDNITVQHFQFDDGADGGETTSSRGQQAEVVWIEHKSMNALRQKVEEALNPKPAPDAEQADPELVAAPRVSYYVEDVDVDNNALATEFNKGRSTKFVIPFTTDDTGAVSLSPATRWMEVKQAMIAASDPPDFDSVAAQMIQGKLMIRLAEMLGADGYKKFAISDVSIDRRLKIKNKETGAEYVTSFTMLSDGLPYIEPADQWERTKAPDRSGLALVDEIHRVSKTKVSSSDTPEARVQAARQRRQRLLSR